MNLFAEATEEFNHQRIDLFLKSTLSDDLSRSLIQKWIRSGCVITATGKTILKPNYLITTGETFRIAVPVRTKVNLEPIKMDIPVVRDFPDYLIINKPAGIASHAGPGDDSPSLVNGLLYQFRELSGGMDETRPGIVHRLDKPTSGLMLIAKNDKAQYLLSSLFQERKIYKRYIAWTLNSPKEAEGTIRLPIGRHPVERLKMCITEKGKLAITHYKIRKTVTNRTGQKYSLIEAEIETGRTHQIRVHLQHLGAPVVGDMLYSKSGLKYDKFGLLLFAQKLKFKCPFSGENIEIELPLPERFIEFETKYEYI